jgi:sugar transferase EpsL
MLKCALDLFSVQIAVPFWLPVLAIVALLVRVKLGGPAFFRQKRPGIRGEIFELIKFRTMLDSRDRDGRPLPDSERLTPFGRWLRSTNCPNFGMCCAAISDSSGHVR